MVGNPVRYFCIASQQEGKGESLRSVGYDKRIRTEQRD